MDGLRECPFCGNKELRRNKLNNFIPEYIHCDKCGGMNNSVAWNTRASDKMIRELIDEMIRELIKVVESMIGAVIDRRRPHEIEDDW